MCCVSWTLRLIMKSLVFMWHDPYGHPFPRDLPYHLLILGLCWTPVSCPQLEANLLSSLKSATRGLLVLLVLWQQQLLRLHLAGSRERQSQERDWLENVHCKESGQPQACKQRGSATEDLKLLKKKKLEGTEAIWKIGGTTERKERQKEERRKETGNARGKGVFQGKVQS